MVTNFRALLLAWVLLAVLAPPAMAQPTLEVVKKRGHLICGVNGLAPGFSASNATKNWQGMDVDLCRAIAAAVLGDAAKAEFLPLSAQERFTALEAGKVDVLARNSTISLSKIAEGRK